ncbi:MAG TPA: hypothetical protein PKY77_18145 [Phycisphaerae bacterium]|nr:hypothetical protein [Phycisphaerae bacterium]HRY70189.1 hypothetical protein [Phycisphaerae bacterium]HSA27404.1 hypothetical protein [Phycisphaerae bacterium]
MLGDVSFTWNELEYLGNARDEWRFPIPPTCRKCSYILHGLKQHRCPECGATFDWREVRGRAAKTWTHMLRLQHANKDSRMGLMLAGVGWAGALLFRLPGISVLSPLANFVACVAGLLAIVLGCQVLNIRRIPAPIRPHISNPPPSIRLGVAAMILGLSVLLGALLIP